MQPCDNTKFVWRESEWRRADQCCQTPLVCLASGLISVLWIKALSIHPSVRLPTAVESAAWTDVPHFQANMTPLHSYQPILVQINLLRPISLSLFLCVSLFSPASLSLCSLFLLSLPLPKAITWFSYHFNTTLLPHDSVLFLHSLCLFHTFFSFPPSFSLSLFIFRFLFLNCNLMAQCSAVIRQFAFRWIDQGGKKDNEVA